MFYSGIIILTRFDFTLQIIKLRIMLIGLSLASISFITLYIVSGSTTTTAPTQSSECVPYVETLNFFDSNMDGKWLYDEDNNHYRLNISDSTSYYTMHYELINFMTGFWDIYLIDESGPSSDYLTYCEQIDITFCAGNWMIFDDDIETWIFDPDATSLHYNCSDTNCDLSDFNESDTNC